MAKIKIIRNTRKKHTCCAILKTAKIAFAYLQWLTETEPKDTVIYTWHI